MATKYQYLDSSGRIITNLGRSGAAPSASELSGKGAAAYISFDDTIDDRFSKRSRITSRNYSSNRSRTTFGDMPFATEYLLYLGNSAGGSGGGSLDIGEYIHQTVGGSTLSAIVTSMEYTTDQWKGNTGGWILGIKNTGISSGTGGPTMPVTGGYILGQGNTQGGSGGGSYDVNTVEMLIQPSEFLDVARQIEYDAITAPDYTAIVYNSAGNTKDLTTYELDTSVGFSDEFRRVFTNHEIYGTTHASSITSVLVYDNAGLSASINATSGGTPDAASSELHTMIYNRMAVDAEQMTWIREITDKYGATDGSLDSVHKIRTVYNT